MKGLKKVFASLLVVILVVTNIPMQSVQAVETTGEEMTFNEAQDATPIVADNEGTSEETQKNEEVIVEESPCSSIEILNIESVIEDEKCYINEQGNKIYEIPNFSYQVVFDDGSSYVGYYSSETQYSSDNTLVVSSQQDETPWEIGKENGFTVKYRDLELCVNVKIHQSSLFDYYEENGNIYFLGYQGEDEIFTVPSELSGKPVVALLGLGNVAKNVKKVVIPDSIVTIAETAFSGANCSSLETIVVGNRVNYLHMNMFQGCNQLTYIYVSDNNELYCSVDGVVYDKAQETIIAYPPARGDKYVVPATVSNIEVMLQKEQRNVSLSVANASDEFVEEDGIIYNADKTKVISCNATKSGEVVLPDTIVEIADYAFENCEGITNVILPEGLNSIGIYAFSQTGIRSLDIPDNVTEIGSEAFYCCSQLENVTVGQGVSHIPYNAFAVCTNLKEVILKNDSVEIETWAFSYSSLEKINMQNVCRMWDYAFEGTNLTEVSIAEGVTELAYRAFYNCASLSEVDIPESIVSAYAQTFEGTNWYESQADGAVYLEHVLCGYKGTMPENTELEVKDGITVIADYALQDFENLTGVILPRGLKVIGFCAFYNCFNLREITIPASVESLYEAFYGCDSLNRVYIDVNSPYFTNIGGSIYNKDGTELMWKSPVSYGEEEVYITDISFQPIELIEDYDGYYQKAYDPQTGEYIGEYFCYSFSPVFSVTFSDGTILENQQYSINYNGRYYPLTVTTSQSYQKQWSVGLHSATVKLMGVSTQFTVNIVENPIESIECKDYEVFEETQGYYTKDYDMQTGEELGEYFRYWASPICTITLKDGSEQTGGFNYNGTYYGVGINTNQSYNNQWGIGRHKVTVSLLGRQAEYYITIKETPIERVVCNGLEIVEKTNGDYQSGYDWETGENWEYYHYSAYPTFTVVFKDGTVLENQKYGIQYDGQYYNFDIANEQSYKNQWFVGVHNATARLMGVETTYNVTILESPIEKIAVEDVTIIEGTNGYYRTEYLPDGQVEYFHYNINAAYTVTFKDGTVIKTNQNAGINYNNQYYSIGVSSDQSYQNQWGIGTHQIILSVLGVETTYNVNIVKSPYVSIEIINMAQVIEGENCRIQGDKLIYNIPNFSYRVIKEDGSTFIGYYNEPDNWWDESGSNDSLVSVSSDQLENPWVVGGNNYFTVSYLGTETKVKVEIQPSSPYEYYEENGGIYITNCKMPTEVLEIPSEIDGSPVVAIMDLGDGNWNVKELIIPDSVTTIAQSAFSDMYELEKVSIGCGVSYLSVDLLCRWELKEIVVSQKNPFYSSIDGVVYDKEGATIIAYPRAKGTEFTVPKEVTNADVMFAAYGDINLKFEEGSKAYVKEDGVLYAENKTKVISCDKDKIGEYIMPDSVTEILDYAFVDCTQLTNVVVSQNVTSIAYCAFMNCSSLANVELPNKLTTIERKAFSSCQSLDGMELPETLETIEREAFEYSGVTSVVIPNSVTEMGDYAFYSSDMLEVAIGTGLTKISHGAFQQTKLTSVNLSNNIESIEQDAFSYTPLEHVVLGESVKTIGIEAFYHTNLKELEIPNSVTHIGDSAFLGVDITELVIPDSVIDMGYSVFAGCDNLTSVTVGKGISFVPHGTFSGCKNLKKVVLENDAVEIGAGAFSQCPLLDEMEWENVQGSIGLGAFEGSGFTSISLSEGVTEVVYEAFMNSTALAEIDVPTSLLHVGGTAFDNTAWYNAQPEGLVYLEHILYKYKGTFPEKAELTIQDGTTVLTDNIFKNNADLTKIHLPEGLLTVGHESFYGCSNLTEIILPSTVEFIGEYAFYNSGITEITIPKSVKHIEKQAFSYDKMTAIYVDPDNQYYSSIDGVLFNKDCTELLWCPRRTESTYTVPKTVTYIAPNAFTNSGVTELIVKNHYTELAQTSYGYEKLPNATSNGQYLDCKIVCYENSLADVYARKNYIPVEIAEPDVTGISIHSMPVKTEYELQETLDTTGLSLFVTLSNGATEIVTEGFEVTNFDSSTVGNKNVTVTYKEFTVSFDIYVKEPTLVGISVGNMPTKTEYERNEELDVTGLSLITHYSNGSVGVAKNGFDVSSFDSTEVGTKKLTVSYEGFTTEFSVYVKEPTITRIAVENMPVKTEYERNEKLDTTGLSITVTYSDKSTKSVTSGFEISAFDSTTTGIKTLTVNYEGFTTEFTVRVKEPTVTGITVSKVPDKLVYEVGENIDTTGMSLLVSYSDGSTQHITSGFELGKYDLNDAGEKMITVIYEGHSATFEVVVKQSGKVIIGNAKGSSGQQVEVTISFEKAMSVKSLAIHGLVYDTSKLQLVSGTWAEKGILTDWNMEKQEGVLTFSEETEVEHIFTLTFLILEGTEDGEIPIECQVVATEQFENKVESKVALTYEYGKVTVHNVLLGDMDGNDMVNSDDAIYLLYHTMMSDKYPANQDCDFNGDNMVNSDDAIYLLYYVMMPDKYPIA